MLSEFIEYLKLADSIATYLVGRLGLVRNLFTSQQRSIMRLDYHEEREKASKDVLEQMALANSTGHNCLANLPKREDLPHDKTSVGYFNLHLLEHFFTSNIKLFATFFCHLFEDYGVAWTGGDFKGIFKCCGDDRRPELVLDSLDGLLIGHRARVVQLETMKEEAKEGGH